MVDVAADQRLDVFDRVDSDVQTIAVHDGALLARASSYGEPFAYRPEDRPAMAIDGDAATAWRVGDHGEPVGEFIEVTLQSTAVPRTSMTVRQPTPDLGGRIITAITASVSDGEPQRIELDDRSMQASGQTITIDPMASGTTVRLVIAEVSTGDPFLASSRAGVGFTEIDLGVGSSTEWIRPPIDALASIDDAQLDVVFSRLRIDPADWWRRDPEVRLHRQLPLADPRAFEGTVTLRLDRNADEAVLAGFLGAEGGVANTRLRGSLLHRGAAALDGDVDTAWVTPFDGAIGASLTFDTALPSSLTLLQPVGNYSPVTTLRFERSGTSVDVVVPAPDAEGRSVLELPTALTAASGPTRATITTIEPRTTVDRRYGDVLTLPAAIAELGGVETGQDPVAPTSVIALDCDATLLAVDGVGVPLSLRTSRDSLLAGEPVTATLCDPLSLGAGDHRIMAMSNAVVPLHIDRLVLSSVDRDDSVAARPPEVTVERNDTFERQVRLSACTRGCWLVLGEGYNTGWSASIEAGSLGEPTLVDGGFNGWWIAPTDLPTTVVIQWNQQSVVTVGLLWSAAAALLAVLLVVGAAMARDQWRRRIVGTARTAPAIVGVWQTRSGLRRRPAIAATAVLVVASGALIAPGWAVAALVVGIGAVLLAPWHVRVMELAGLGSACAVAVAVVWIERRDAPIPNAGWTVAFEHLHGLSVFAVLALAVGSFLGRDA